MAIVPYAGTDTRGLVGMHANAEEWNAITRLADNVVSAPIGVGQPVARYAGNDKVCRAWTSGPVFGITRWKIDADTTTGFKEGDHVSIMTMGVMWVAAGGTCTAGDQAGYDPATDRWSDVSGDFVAVTGAEFDTNAANGQLVALRINRPATSS